MIKLKKYLIILLLMSITILNSKDLTKVNITNDDARNAVMALNHMHSSLNKIVSYNDKIVLEEEYDNIINNINLTVIQDREVVNVITYLMDTLTTFKLTEMEKEKFQREYQVKLDNAISGALSGLSISGSDPITMGISFVTSAGSAYMSYKEGQKDAKKGLDKGKWELKKDILSELNEIRKDFLLTYWKIMKKYNMPDKWRITEKQFTRFITILKDNDINKKYRQLIRMKNELEVFPNYWYELSLVAHKLNKKDDELNAILKYESLNDKLLRDNSLYSLMLANKTTYLDYKTESVQIIRILEKIYKIDPLNPERKLFMAMKYLQIGQTKKAENLLNENIDDNFLPILSQRLKVNMYLKDNMNKDYEDTINSLLNTQNLSASEYLFYLGKRPLPLLINEIQKQIKEIKIVLKKTLYGNDDLYIWLPKQWVYNDIENTELIVNLADKEYNFTKISKEDGFIIYYYENIMNSKNIIDKKIQSLNLKLVHKNIPILLSYHINILSDKKASIDNKIIVEEKSSYWDKAKKIAYDNSIQNVYNKSKNKYSEYTTKFRFIGQSITARDKCFDLTNSLKPCK